MTPAEKMWSKALSYDGDQISLRIASATQDFVSLGLLVLSVCVIHRAIREADFTGYKPWLLALWMFFGFHFIKCLIRGGCVLDKRDRTITRWRGWCFPFQRRMFSWDEVRAVRVLTRKVTKNFAISSWCTVVLDGPAGMIPIKHLHSWVVADDFARRLSSYMGIEYWAEPKL